MDATLVRSCPPSEPLSCQCCGEDSINPSCTWPPPSPLRSERWRELKFTHVCPRGNHLSVAQCAKDPLSPKLLRNLYLPVVALSPSFSLPSPLWRGSADGGGVGGSCQRNHDTDNMTQHITVGRHRRHTPPVVMQSLFCPQRQTLQFNLTVLYLSQH